MIKIYEEKPEKDVYLKLFQHGRSITLCCVDSDGDEIPDKNILGITKDGIYRFKDLGDYNFELDSSGRIKLNE